MVLYESNYRKLTSLTGRLNGDGSKWISRAFGDHELYLERTLSEAYTTTFKMTYWLRDAAGHPVMDPDLTVRVYEDAALAEALSCRSQHEHGWFRRHGSSPSGELNRRWHLNMMLNKWLDYLIDSGHGFA
ncbi:MAG: DUF1249 domain-containing protein [Gammaproteobacteria bacterium]|nr:DUF1249 domain-containing protein [Gammaproteobacteria bacterium]